MEEAAIEIFQPVMESATVLAAHYAQACGRDVVLAEDMRMGLMYAARHVTGRQIGTLFPEIYDENSESDSSSSWETVSDEDFVWERYSGADNEMALKMNECADTWDAWEPESPVERALKNAIDKQREQ
jgi:hypothetical protein